LIADHATAGKISLFESTAVCCKYCGTGVISANQMPILHHLAGFMAYYYVAHPKSDYTRDGERQILFHRNEGHSMKVVAFNGSGRKDGNTLILLRTVLDELENEGIETELVQMAGTPIQGCTACLKCMERKNMQCSIDRDPFNGYFEKISAADGLLLGSPVYFSDITAGMKALIERTGFVARANGNILRRKVGAGVLAVRRAGSNHALASLNYLFLISEMIVPGSNYWNMGIGRNPGEVRNDTEGLQTMKTLGVNMAWLLKATANCR
jgi:multimeric flavodoxin WrbA